MTSKCLICDADVPLTNGVNAPMGKNPKKYRSSDSNVFPPVLCDRKFALTNIQYTVLQKVLTLPDGACKNELILGPYCRECFTNINNVCHCMSALENLQQSVVEFRKEFSSKMHNSCGGAMSTSSAARKRKSNSTSDQDIHPVSSARSMILNYLNKSVFPVGVFPMDSSKPVKHNIHEIISNMDPNTQFPETHVNAEMVVCTTNGNMPTLKRNGTVKKKKVKSSKKMSHLTPKKKLKKKKITPTIPTTNESKLLRVVISNQSSSNIIMAEPEDTQQEHKCWCCSKIFNTEEKLKKHEEVAHRKKCTFPGCTKVFYTGKSLQGHILKTHKIPTPTTPKTDNVPPASNPKLHKLSTKITAKKAFDVRRMKKCDDCSRYFPNYKTLANHRFKEHNVQLPVVTNKASSASRPGRCKVCKKIVIDVQVHMRSEHPDEFSIESNKQTQKKGRESSITRSSQRNAAMSPQTRSDEQTEPNKEAKLAEIKTDNDNLFTLKTPTFAGTGSGSETSELENRKKVISSLSSPTRSSTSLNFQVPTSVLGRGTLPSPPSSQNQAGSTTSSKYQFKNLLKIGDQK